MADTTGYYFFGGGVDDYARAYASDTLLLNTPLTITNPATGATLTDLLDGTSNPDSTISTDAAGEFRFWARLAVVNVQAAGGGVYQVVAKSVLVQAATGGDQSAQVAAATQAALAAQNAASAAAAAAAGAVKTVTLGQVNGVATLDGQGRQPSSQVNSDLADQINQMQDEIDAATAGVRDHQVFAFQSSDSSLAAGVPSSAWLSPGVDSLLDSVFMQLDDYSSSAVTSFDVQKNPPPYTGGFLSCYGASKPQVGIGGTAAFGATPADPTIPARSQVRVVPASVAPNGTGSGTPAARKGTMGVYSTGTSTANNTTSDSSGVGGTVGMTLPAGGAAGDTVLVAIACPGAVTINKPVGWTQIANAIDSGTRAQIGVYAAPWSAGLSVAFGLSSGSSMEAIIQLLSGTDVATLVGTTKTDFQNGVSDTGPAGATGVASDLILEFAAIDFPNPTAVPSGTVESGGPTSITEDRDHYTTRATIRNVGLVGIHAPGVASGTNVAATTYTTSGTSLGTNMTWAIARILVPRGAGTHGPSKALVQVDLVSS